MMFTIDLMGTLRPSLLENLFRSAFKKLQPVLVFSLLVFVWFYTWLHLHAIDPTATLIDQGMWLLVILSMICFLLIVALCWWLLQHFWLVMGLPVLSSLVSQFNTLALWQQLGFYWASFVMLLLVASECLKAMC